ncbi:hypothetical protein C9374_000987 [Naegleria lovaniensis]|uniref:AAA-ATPase-like domain-containing protein n=1 Tax=Naegleria lovaniensis TaxID=51637 RepID=A0AA88KSM1_NAELO|nr:uncharacterized protein C9374_000987 [Naegleria lovaniensis]KAG2388137.1 hypothetical protein C9374_000987 [Naegleria lovaniensis]
MLKRSSLLLSGYSSIWRRLYHSPSSPHSNIFLSHSDQYCCIRRFSTMLKPSERHANYFPYGNENFASIRREKQFYVDKTHLIPFLERTGDLLFFTRPPRWGKSLLLSMLDAYYNINKADQFSELFDGLWIAHPKNQTVFKNQFHVLRLNFSITIDYTSNSIKRPLYDVINGAISHFIRENGLDDNIIHPTDALISFDNLVFYCLRNKMKLMLLVDESDRIVHKFMFEFPDRYTGDAILSPIRSFFERIKNAESCDFRALVVGITPFLLFDFLGFPFAIDISHLSQFQDVVGFSKKDLQKAVADIGISNEDHRHNILSVMYKYYAGYYFPGSVEPLFHPQLSFHFLQLLMRHDAFRHNVVQGKDVSIYALIDDNVKIGKSVFDTLSRIPIFRPIVQRSTSTNMVNFFNSYRHVGTYPSPKYILDPPTSAAHQKEVWNCVLTFMYYHGMLTLLPFKEFGESTLVVPNEVVKYQYLDQLLKILAIDGSNIERFMNYPSEDTLTNLLWSILEPVYDVTMPEDGLQGSFEAALSAYNSNLFKLTSNRENTQIGGMKPHPHGSSLLIETARSVIIIEFTRLKPNSLEEYENFSHFMTPKEFKFAFRELLNADEKRLLSMKVISNTSISTAPAETESFSFKDTRNNETTTTVENILNDAAVRARAQTQHESNNVKIKEKSIHTFVVVQVAWPLIVRKLI